MLLDALLRTIEFHDASINLQILQHFLKAAANQQLQVHLLQLLGERQGLTPREVWDALGVSKQGAVKLIKPLLEAKLIQRVGTRKSGRYILASRSGQSGTKKRHRSTH